MDRSYGPDGEYVRLRELHFRDSEEYNLTMAINLTYMAPEIMPAHFVPGTLQTHCADGAI